MQVTIDGAVVADAPESELVKIEGNWYFPPSSVKDGYLVESATPYTCPWKGECQYFSVKDGDKLLQDLPSRRRLKIDRDRALVRRLGQEPGAHVGVVQCVIGATAAALVGIVRVLDLDDVGALQRKLVGGKRPGQHMRDVDDADALERTPHGRAPTNSATVAPCPHGVNTLG